MLDSLLFFLFRRLLLGCELLFQVGYLLSLSLNGHLLFLLLRYFSQPLLFVKSLDFSFLLSFECFSLLSRSLCCLSPLFHFHLALCVFSPLLLCLFVLFLQVRDIGLPTTLVVLPVIHRVDRVPPSVVRVVLVIPPPPAAIIPILLVLLVVIFLFGRLVLFCVLLMYSMLLHDFLGPCDTVKGRSVKRSDALLFSKSLGGCDSFLSLYFLLLFALFESPLRLGLSLLLSSFANLKPLRMLIFQMIEVLLKPLQLLGLLCLPLLFRLLVDGLVLLLQGLSCERGLYGLLGLEILFAGLGQVVGI